MNMGILGIRMFLGRAINEVVSQVEQQENRWNKVEPEVAFTRGSIEKSKTEMLRSRHHKQVGLKK
jgi:hypothetical protein